MDEYLARGGKNKYDHTHMHKYSKVIELSM